MVAPLCRHLSSRTVSKHSFNACRRSPVLDLPQSPQASPVARQFFNKKPAIAYGGFSYGRYSKSTVLQQLALISALAAYLHIPISGPARARHPPDFCRVVPDRMRRKRALALRHRRKERNRSKTGNLHTPTPQGVGTPFIITIPSTNVSQYGHAGRFWSSGQPCQP